MWESIMIRTVTLYTCHVCKKESEWTKTHAHLIRPNGMFDKYFFTCSNECRHNQKDIYIKWLSNLKGFSKERALKDYSKLSLSLNIQL